MPDKKGEVLKKLINARNNIRIANEVVEKHKNEYDGLVQQMLSLMKEDGVTTTGNSEIASCSIRNTVVANVTDWDKYYRYIKKNNAFYLLQKRVSDAAWREEREDRKGRAIPGTEPFNKIGLNLRVANK